MEKMETEEGWPHAAEPCGDAPWWHGRISDDGVAAEVQLRHRGQRGDGSEGSGAQ